MLKTLSSISNTPASVVASGTVVASDIESLLSETSLPKVNGGGAIIFVDDDFDGYLSELIRGAETVAAQRAQHSFRIAILLDDSAMTEARQNRWVGTNESVKLFRPDQRGDAASWLKS